VTNPFLGFEYLSLLVPELGASQRLECEKSTRNAGSTGSVQLRLIGHSFFRLLLQSSLTYTDVAHGEILGAQ